MLASNTASSLIEHIDQLAGNSGKLKPLPVLSRYSGFVPNEIFQTCAPVQIMVYAVVQYLSFFDIKCSASNVAKNLNASSGTVRNALNSLSNAKVILKQQDGTFLFRSHLQDPSTDFLPAKEMTRRHLGYWLPIETLKSKKINNKDKKTLALISSLIHMKKEKKLEMKYIAQKLGVAKNAASQSVGRLLRQQLISRHRMHTRSAYIYQHGRNENMSIYKKDLPTAAQPTGSLNEQRTQNDPSKCTQNDPPISINKSNKFLIENSKYNSESGTYKSGQKKSLFFFKETIDFLLAEIALLERQQEGPEDLGMLNAQYTQACIDCDLEKINELRARLASAELEQGRVVQKTGSATKIKATLTDYEYCLKNERSTFITDEQKESIKKAVKHKVGLSQHDDDKKRNMALCLIFNSFILDTKSQYLKSQNIDDAMEICLRRLANDAYEINYELVSKTTQKGLQDDKPASNQPFGYKKHWNDCLNLIQ